MKRIVTLCLSLVAGASLLCAQPEINGQFVLLTNDGTDYTIKVQVSLSSGSAALGYATMQFTFNNTDLALPSSPAAGTDYMFHNFNTGSYITPTVTRANANTVSINIEFNTGAATSVDTNPLDVVTIKFSTVNPGGYSNLVWGLREIFGTDFTPWTLKTWDNRNDLPLPVQLSSFEAISTGDGAIELRWTTLSERNNYGFYIERRAEGEREFAEIPESFIAGHGTTIEPQEYSYLDRPGKSGTYFYRLKQVDLDGSVHLSDPVRTGVLASVREVAPIEFRLMQNFPNPFNPTTVLTFSVQTPGRATLQIYSITGQEVAKLYDDVAEPGRYYTVRLDGTHLASGVYFYRLDSGTKTDVKKLLLLR